MTLEDGITLYHGSYTEIDSVDLSKCLRGKDFGKGFYIGKALSLFTMDNFQCELEKLLGCKVDIVRMRDNMNSMLRKRITEEGCYV